MRKKPSIFIRIEHINVCIGMGCMGKTIALKLNEQEEQIIAQLNNQGISNSELLRKALRQYITNMPEYSCSENDIKNVFINNKNEQMDFTEEFKELRHEMQQLREQMKTTQNQVESNVLALQRRLYLISITNSNTQQMLTPLKLDIAQDIHRQVDDFLNKRREKSDRQEDLRIT